MIEPVHAVLAIPAVAAPILALVSSYLSLFINAAPLLWPQAMGLP